MQYSLPVMFHAFPVAREENTAVIRRNTGTACHRGMWKSGTHLLRWEEGDNSNNHNHITMSQCRLGGLVLTGRCATCACSLCSREDKHSISKDHCNCTYHMAGNIGWELNLVIWSSVGSPKLLLQKLILYGCTTGVSGCWEYGSLRSRKNALQPLDHSHCILANLCMLFGVVVVFPLFGGSVFHNTGHGIRCLCPNLVAWNQGIRRLLEQQYSLSVHCVHISKYKEAESLPTAETWVSPSVWINTNSSTHRESSASDAESSCAVYK